MEIKNNNILHKFFKKQETDVVYLEICQLDYSSRILRYIQKTKNKEIRKLYNLIESKRMIFELLVYNGTNDKTYHVYGQEMSSSYNAFLFGALLADNRFNVDNAKICIMGIINNNGGDIEKIKELELNNLNELYENREIFKMEQNGDIVPTFPLSPRIKNIVNIPSVLDRQKIFSLPTWGCMEGYDGCISNCNYFIEGIDDNECSDRRCNFFCVKGRELIDCDNTCDGYVKISDKDHCCNYEFALSCGTGK